MCRAKESRQQNGKHQRDADIKQHIKKGDKHEKQTSKVRIPI